jgi:hypothetical protein
MFTRARPWFLPWDRCIHFTSSQPASVKFILILSSCLCICLPVGLFPSSCMHFTFLPCVLHSVIKLTPWQNTYFEQLMITYGSGIPSCSRRSITVNPKPRHVLSLEPADFCSHLAIQRAPALPSNGQQPPPSISITTFHYSHSIRRCITSIIDIVSLNNPIIDK